MPDYNNIEIPQQQVADVLAEQKPVEQPNYNVGAAKVFLDKQKEAVQKAAYHQKQEQEAKVQAQAQRIDEINAITDNIVKQKMPNVSMLNPKFAEYRTQVAKQVESHLANQDIKKEDEVNRKFATMPNSAFGFGKDQELGDKVSRLRTDIYESAKQAINYLLR